jgi:hypothetical protein
MWYIDASFAVHLNMCGPAGGGLTMGQGFPIVASWKQKLNTKSSTESELVGIDDMMPIMLWTCYFLLSQGYGRSHVAEWFSDALSSRRPGFETSTWQTKYNP